MIQGIMIEDLKLKGFALAADSLEIRVAGGSMHGRRLLCR